MTITFGWWVIPLILVIAAFVVPKIWFNKKSSDWDFYTPFMTLGFFAVFIVAAIAISLGYWMGATK
jgi:uncharacterized membrane protein